MDRILKKKIARETLLFFGILGLTILFVFCIWCYSIIIDSQIDKQTSIIFSAKRELTKLSPRHGDSGWIPSETAEKDLTELSNRYNRKFLKIKEFLTYLKTQEDEGLRSNFSLYYFNTKALNYNKTVEKIEKEQSINGKLPNPADTAVYLDCIRPICTHDKWSKYLKYTDDDLLSVWNCLVNKKENLYYFLPLTVLWEFNISNKTDLVNFFDKNSFTKEELDIQTKITSLNSKIESLEQKRSTLQIKAIDGDEIYSLGLFSLITLLVIAYPVRLIFLTIKWALRTYREP